jgi:hypothetical protein
MNIDHIMADLNVFCTHENTAIAEFATRAMSYSQALAQGEMSPDEYQSLMGDLDSLKRMARSADEENTMTTIFQIAMLVPALV